MSVFRDLRVPIPKERVVIERQKEGPALIKYVIESHYDSRKGYPVATRTTIGHQCSDSATEMHPTTQYGKVFTSKWEEITQKKQKPSLLKIGMFSACQAINSKCGIKDMLDEAYGADRADQIMDFGIYSMVFHSNDASDFTAKMRNELTYAKHPFSDSTYSRLFEDGMSKDSELLFKKKWALHCKEEGVEGVWLCIDGSNDDCHSKGVEIAEKGHAKSGKNVKIVSFTYAVSVDGLPVTYDVYRGGLVDAKAMKKILDFLNQCGIKVLGVILDRGYCDAKAISYLINKKLDYIIMIKGNPDGYVDVVKEYGNKIKVQAEYFIPGTNLFGVQCPMQLFKGLKHQDYISLFFDHQNGGDRIDALIKKVNNELERLEAALEKGKEVSVCAELSSILSISEGKDKAVNINAAALQAAFDEKGLYGIVTSKPMPLREVHYRYSSRDASEVMYRIVKTELGYGSVNVEYTPGVRARFAVAFVASIVRYFIEVAAKTVERNTNQMIQDLESLEAEKLNGAYSFTHTENERVKTFFRALGPDSDKLLDESVDFENDRQAGRVPTPRHRKPGPKKGSQQNRSDSAENVAPKKRGVTQGTKRSEFNKDGTPRKKPGVAPGTKRGQFNKDGTLRKKPGPKPKVG